MDTIINIHALKNDILFHISDKNGYFISSFCLLLIKYVNTKTVLHIKLVCQGAALFPFLKNFWFGETQLTTILLKVNVIL
jgi:hypothetical protein